MGIKRAKNAWRVDWRDEYGRRKRLTFGSRDAANHFLTKERAKVQVIQAKGLPQRISLKEYADSWLKKVQTGMRPGEIMALKFGDFDLLNNKIHVERSLNRDSSFTTIKTGKSRLVDITPHLRPFFVNWRHLKDVQLDGHFLDTPKMPVAVGERNNYENKVGLGYLRDRPTAGHLALTQGI